MSDKSKKEDRGFLYSLVDNLVGFDDGYDTPGEKLGKVVNTVATKPVETGKALAIGIKNEMEDVLAGPVAYAKTDRPVLPDGTVPLGPKEEEQYFNSMLGLAAAPMAPGAKSLLTRDPNKVNIFAGRSALKVDDRKINKAMDMKAKGHTDREIWDTLQIQYDKVNDQWQSIIDPNQARFTQKNEKEFLNYIADTLTDPNNEFNAADLGKILDFPELYENYPNLRNTKLIIRGKGDGGSFNGQENLLNIGEKALRNPKRAKEVITHELQHGVQAHDWSVGGAASSYFFETGYDNGKFKAITHSKDKDLKEVVDRVNYLSAYKDDVIKNWDVADDGSWIPDSAESADEYRRVLVEINKETDKGRTLVWFKYQGNPGRIEARASANLLEQTGKEIKELMPSEHKRQAQRILPEEYTKSIMPTGRMGQPDGYAKGGTVMKEVDPVSGNEVPAGALPEEVRDDVDAKLSEGEYVIPANVVRYYGIAHFEKQIDKASQALEELSAKGRIGGEKGTPPPMPEDDLPFTDEELMAGEVEMNEGGLVPDTFDPSDFVSGFSTFNTNPYDQSGGSDKGIKNKIYIGPDGRRRVVMYIDDIPLSHVPDGYVEDTPENRAARELKEAPDTPLKEGGRTGAENDADMNSYDPSGRTPDQLGKDVARAGKFGAFAGMLGGPGVAKAGSELSKAGTLEAIAEDRNISIEEAKDLTNSKLSGFMSRQAQKNVDRNKSDSSFDVSFDPDRGVYSADGIEVSKDLMDSVQSAIGAPAPSAPSPSAPSAPDPSPDGDDGDDGDNGYGGVGNDAYGYMNKGGLVTRNTTKKKSRRVVPKGKGLATRK